MIVDRLGRQFSNLRVSLTAACNYACTYCVPDGKRLMKAQNELPADDLLKAVKLLQQATGIDKVRITGGEPLVAPKFDVFLPGVMELGLSDVSLTTNGQLLLGKKELIRDSGLKRMNISLDTLNPLKFRHIARSGDLETVLAGIDAMLELGLKLKINMVPMRSENFSEIVPMLKFCLDRGIELRFIELMRMGHLLGNNAFQADFVSMETLLDEIGNEFYRQLIELNKLCRQVLNISDLMSKLDNIPGDYGTFAVFHKQTPIGVSEIASFIAERGYVSYQYKKAPLRSYVHGNLDAIDDTLTPLSGSSFLNRKYNLQFLLHPNNSYEIALVNTSSSNKKVKFEIVSFSDNVQLKETVILKSKQIFLLPLKNLLTLRRLVIHSKMIMARPVLFSFHEDKLDVFHG